MNNVNYGKGRIGGTKYGDVNVGETLMVILEDGIGIVFLSNAANGCDQDDNTAFNYDKVYTYRLYTEGIDYIYTLIFMAIPAMAYYGDYTRAWRSRSLRG